MWQSTPLTKTPRALRYARLIIQEAQCHGGGGGGGGGARARAEKKGMNSIFQHIQNTIATINVLTHLILEHPVPPSRHPRHEGSLSSLGMLLAKGLGFAAGKWGRGEGEYPHSEVEPS